MARFTHDYVNQREFSRPIKNATASTSPQAIRRHKCSLDTKSTRLSTVQGIVRVLSELVPECDLLLVTLKLVLFYSRQKIAIACKRQ